MIEWDDIRFFLGAARCGSFGTAAARLNTSVATVSRRVLRLETALKTTLFARSASGVQLTPAGLRLMEAGCLVENAVDAAQNVQENFPSGNIRISVSEGFGTLVLAPMLHKLSAAYPALSIELAAWGGSLSISRREVDMAVMFKPPPSRRLHVEKLCEFEGGYYCSTSFCERYGTPASVADLQSVPAVGFIDDLLYAPELQYLDERNRHPHYHLATSSSRALLEIAGSGAGVAMLPCFMAAHDPRLIRLIPEIVTVRGCLWLATHDEVLGSARYHAVRSWLFDTIEAVRPTMLTTPG